jgi:hypothetical protein
VTDEEADIPLAYSILFYSGIGQFEKLLHSIYRPHNVYCLHVDLKASDEDLAAIRAIAGCLGNVFLSSRRYLIHWGHISILHAELTCMSDLLQASASWSYLINLSAQMYPLHSNLYTVRYVRTLNGTSDIEVLK